MSARLEWTAYALERVEELSDFLARRSRAAAAQAVAELFERSALLRDQPELGHTLAVLDDPRVREMYFDPYRVLCFHDAAGAAVVILCVQHGREQPLDAEAAAALVGPADPTPR